MQNQLIHKSVDKRIHEFCNMKNEELDKLTNRFSELLMSELAKFKKHLIDFEPKIDEE